MCLRLQIFVALVVALAHARQPHAAKSVVHASHELEAIDTKSIPFSCPLTENVAQLDSYPITFPKGKKPNPARGWDVLDNSVLADFLVNAACQSSISEIMLMRHLFVAVNNYPQSKWSASPAFTAAVKAIKKFDVSDYNVDIRERQLFVDKLVKPTRPAKGDLVTFFGAMKTNYMDLLTSWDNSFGNTGRAAFVFSDNCDLYEMKAFEMAHLGVPVLGELDLSQGAKSFLNNNPHLTVKKHRFVKGSTSTRPTGSMSKNVRQFVDSELFPDFVAFVLSADEGLLKPIKQVAESRSVKGLSSAQQVELKDHFASWKMKLPTRPYTIAGKITRL